MPQTSEQQFLTAVGKTIARLRSEKNITQEQLSAASGLDRVAIAYIETGKRKPKLSSIFKIARGLGVEVIELFQ